jgi:ATP-binding cassette subfamily F protein 3
MGLSTDKMDTPARDLSGGEKARLLLGLATFHGPNLLILDEPTNHLDIDSRESLVDALNGFDGAVILISHDRHLVEATADRLWLVADGRATAFDGDMDDYRRLVLSGPSESGQDTGRLDSRPSATDRRRQAAEKRAQLAPLRKRIQAVEQRIESLRSARSRLDEALSVPSLFATDPARGTRLSKERADNARAIEAAEEEWLALSGEYEAVEASG